ncbi:hypothetical protein Tco_1516862 [Tanacetum coccineum]
MLQRCKFRQMQIQTDADSDRCRFRQMQTDHISQQQTNGFSRQTDSADRFRQQTDKASDSDRATDQTADSHAYADKPGQNQTNAQPDVSNDDDAIAQRRLEDKQLNGKGPNHENACVKGAGKEGNVAERKKRRSKEAKLENLLKYKAWL